MVLLKTNGMFMKIICIDYAFSFGSVSFWWRVLCMLCPPVWCGYLWKDSIYICSYIKHCLLNVLGLGCMWCWVGVSMWTLNILILNKVCYWFFLEINWCWTVVILLLSYNVQIVNVETSKTTTVHNNNMYNNVAWKLQ